MSLESSVLISLFIRLLAVSTCLNHPFSAAGIKFCSGMQMIFMVAETTRTGHWPLQKSF